MRGMGVVNLFTTEVQQVAAGTWPARPCFACLAFTAARRAAMSSSSPASTSASLSSSLFSAPGAAFSASSAMAACRRAAARLRSPAPSESSESEAASRRRCASRCSRGSLAGFTTTGATNAVRSGCVSTQADCQGRCQTHFDAVTGSGAVFMCSACLEAQRRIVAVPGPCYVNETIATVTNTVHAIKEALTCWTSASSATASSSAVSSSGFTQSGARPGQYRLT